MSSAPVVVIVAVEIVPERREEFLKIMEEDAIGSREREEGGCLRFDVIGDATNENKFYFYEVYRDAEAVARHKQTPHFAGWNTFYESGGVTSLTINRGHGVFYQY